MDDLETEGDTRRLSAEEIDALANDIAVRAATIASATFALLEKIRVFDRAKGWARQGAKDCASWLSWRTGIGRTAAKRQVQVANRLPEFPLVAEAFRKGELSYTKVRAVTREGMPPDKDAILLHQARGATGAQLERISAAYRRHAPGKSPLDEESRYVRKSFHRDGTVSVAIRVLPDEAERIHQAIREMKRKLVEEARAEDPRSEKALPDEHSHSAESESAEDAAAKLPAPTMADAAVAVAEEHLARLDDESPSQPAAEKRQLLIHLREDRICGDEAWTAELHDGTPIRGDSLERLACDCGLVVAKTDVQGDPLALGRRKRSVSASLRRALLIRDRCCQFPGCEQLVSLDLQRRVSVGTSVSDCRTEATYLGVACAGERTRGLVLYLAGAFLATLVTVAHRCAVSPRLVAGRLRRVREARETSGSAVGSEVSVTGTIVDAPLKNRPVLMRTCDVDFDDPAPRSTYVDVESQPFVVATTAGHWLVDTEFIELLVASRCLRGTRNDWPKTIEAAAFIGSEVSLVGTSAGPCQAPAWYGKSQQGYRDGSTAFERVTGNEKQPVVAEARSLPAQISWDDRTTQRHLSGKLQA